MADRGRRSLGTGRGSRRRGFRPVRYKVRLCVEGISEERYLRALLEYRYPGVFAADFCGRGGRRSGRKTSLLNLVEQARRSRREATGEDRWLPVWIVCDVDQNEIHRPRLTAWRDTEPEVHRSVLQAAGIEGWFLQHFEGAHRCATSSAAERELRRCWPDYAKGQECPKWLIDRTDRALERERQFLAERDNNSVWPIERSSQMPLLIAYLDDRAAQHARSSRDR